MSFVAQLTATPAATTAATEDALLVLDSRRRIRQITPRAAALLDRTTEQLIGMPFAELGSLAAIGLSAREQPVFKKTRRASLTVVILRVIDRADGTHDEMVAPWQGSTELALVRSPEGKILTVNEAFARKFGVPRPSWPGQDPSTLVHPDDIRGWFDAIERSQRAPHRVSHEHRWQTAQGWRWLAWEESPVRNEQGELVAFRGIGRDVTKRRLAEEHFQKLASAVEQSPFSIVMTTPDGRVQYVNPMFTKSTGYTLEEIFEKHIPVLREGHANDESFREFEETVAAGRKWGGELCTRCKDGRILWELAQVSPIRNNSDEVTHLLCVREDITERKKLEDQLRQAQKMESLGTLAGGIAHDFNNVLAIINGFSEIALSRSPDDALGRHLREIQNAAQRAIGLVRQILTFSRKTESTFRPVSVNQHVEDLGRMCSETFPRTVAFSFELDKSLPDIAADPSQLQQVIMNLCVNARDAMPGGGHIAVSTQRVTGESIVRLGGDTSRMYLCVKVSDTGCGIPPHVRARIFEPFFTTKQSVGGTGLGLSVVYGIILNHRGFLDVESVEGKGSTFSVYLPIEAVKPMLQEPAQVAGGARRIPHGSETVLVVEDEQSLRDLMRMLLTPCGYRVLTAADGAEAVNMLMSESGPIDAVLLDLNLPHLNGAEVFKNVRRMRPDARVIVISGNITMEVRRELVALGQEDFISKPYQLEEIGRRLRHVLDRRPASAA